MSKYTHEYEKIQMNKFFDDYFEFATIGIEKDIPRQDLIKLYGIFLNRPKL